LWATQDQCAQPPRPLRHLLQSCGNGPWQSDAVMQCWASAARAGAPTPSIALKAIAAAINGKVLAKGLITISSL